MGSESCTCQDCTAPACRVGCLQNARRIAELEAEKAELIEAVKAAAHHITDYSGTLCKCGNCHSSTVRAALAKYAPDHICLTDDEADGQSAQGDK